MQNSYDICRNNVDLCVFRALDDRLRNYLLAFVRCKGKLNKIKREMNITRSEAKILSDELMSIVKGASYEVTQSFTSYRTSCVSEHMGNRFILGQQIK